MNVPFRVARADFVLTVLLALGLATSTWGETHFIEAEAFRHGEGWRPRTGQALASRLTTLSGAEGPVDDVATASVTIAEAGRYRIWVRAVQVATIRGPFVLTAHADGAERASLVVDREAVPAIADRNFGWHSVETELPAGEVALRLAKDGQQNCSGETRQVDCVLVTSDPALTPDHVPFGPQTFLRFTVGGEMARPVYINFFADHYRDPWYSSHVITRQGLAASVADESTLLAPGETAPWSNISSTVYQDSGVSLQFSLLEAGGVRPDRMRARIEFGRADGPDGEVEAVRAFDVDATPNGVVIAVPPDLDSPENIARLRRDAEFAEETGQLADGHPWPTIGRRPERLPFLVSANIGGYNLPVDRAVTARERKTLDYFGFNGSHERVLHGLWLMKDQSYCRPDVDQMRARVKADVERFQQSGRSVYDVAYCMLMDEPLGQEAAFMVKDGAYGDAFRAWIREQGLTPADLGVADEASVRPVIESEREEFPALHYHTQRFRTVALGDFMATQRKILEGAYGGKWPTLVNFSDGAVYYGNFYGQGVDYFELLNRGNQNALWSEDWANFASTYQCSAFNVDLMRAAARKRGEVLGHYLIAHAERTAWDTKLKATSASARGIRLWMNFSYGPTWGSHEGGPTWKSHMWYNRPENWTANAEIPREFGAVEDWLATAKPTPARVAVLYSSSADIWSMENNAAGFDRMHTWLALTHGQIPVDVVSEVDATQGLLDGYAVCYLAGTHLTRAAAESLKAWVESGGTLFISAGAASRDEYNRPLDGFEAILPASRGEMEVLDRFQAGGRALSALTPRDTARWEGATFDVLAMRQAQSPREGAQVLATFDNGGAAVVSARVGAGRVVSAGFLPALSYIRAALVARKAAQEGDRDTTRIERSYNPWEYPADMRERLTALARGGVPAPPLTCDTPLVDAVYLPCDQGVLVALANYTLAPLARVTLTLRHTGAVQGVTSVHRGDLPFKQIADDTIQVTLPLDASDWVKLALEKT